MTRWSRRQYVRSVAGAGLAGLAGCTGDRGCERGLTESEFFATPPDGASWPMPSFDAANTGWNPDASGPRDPDLAWRHSTCDVLDGVHRLHDGRLYVQDGVYDARTGELVDTRAEVGSVVFDDGTMFEATGGLTALATDGGETLWSVEESPGTVRVANDHVYYPERQSIVARAAQTGDERWREPVDDPPVQSIGVTDDAVFAVDDGNRVYAFDATTGERRWRAEVDASVTRCPPSISGDRLYLGTWAEDSEVVALRTADGEEAWRRRVGGKVRGSLAVTDATVFVPTRRGTVSAFETSSGRRRWEVRKDVPELWGPAVAGGVLYVGVALVGPPRVYGIDVTDGSELWSYETRTREILDDTVSGIAPSPMVVDGVLYVVTIAGDVLAFGER